MGISRARASEPRAFSSLLVGLQELVSGYPSLRQNYAQRRSLDLLVVWHGQRRPCAVRIFAPGGLRVIDLSAASGLISVGSAAVPGSRIAISGEHLYLAGGDFHIFDISTPENTVEVGSYDTPSLPKDIAVRATLAYIADDRNLTILDVATPENPVLVGQMGSPGPPGGTGTDLTGQLRRPGQWISGIDHSRRFRAG